MKSLIPQTIPLTLEFQIFKVKLGITDSISLDNYFSIHFDLPLELISRTCPNIESLSMNSNNIKELDSDIKKFTKLKHLSLRDNNLKSIPSELESMLELSTVNLKENPLSLESLLKISTSSKIMYVLDEEHMATLNQINSSPETKEIAKVFVDEYPDISIKEFDALLPLVKAELELKDIYNEVSNLSSAIKKMKSKLDSSKQAEASILDKLNKSVSSKFKNVADTIGFGNVEQEQDSNDIPNLRELVLGNNDTDNENLAQTSNQPNDSKEQVSETEKSTLTPMPKTADLDALAQKTSKKAISKRDRGNTIDDHSDKRYEEKIINELPRDRAIGVSKGRKLKHL